MILKIQLYWKVIGIGLLFQILLPLTSSAQTQRQVDSLAWKTNTAKAVSFLKQQKYDSALVYSKITLAKSKLFFGEEHLSYSVDLANTAYLHLKLGDYIQADELNQKAIDIWQLKLGEKNPLYADRIEMFAKQYLAVGNYNAAILRFRQVVDLRKKYLEELDDKYILALDGLAVIYKLTANFSLAKPLYEEALALTKKKYGDRDQNYASALNNLAWLYVGMDNYAEAEILYKQAISIYKDKLGEDHEYYATGLDNLAELYKLMNNYEQAEPLYKQAIEIRKKAAGANSMIYARSISNLATLYMKTYRNQLAEPLIKESLEIIKNSLGVNHPEYRITLLRLAELYKTSNKSEVEKIYKETLVIAKNTVGENSLDYATSLVELGTFYIDTKQYQLAEPLYIKGLAILEKIYGKNQSEYSTCLNNLVSLYYESKQTEKWAKTIEEAIQIQNKKQHILLRNFSEEEKNIYLDRNKTIESIFLSMLAYFDYKKTSIFYSNINARQGWLLRNRQQLTSLAENSKDAEVKKTLNQWYATNKSYAESIQLTEDSRKRMKINLDSLQKQSQQLEKKLMASFPLLKDLIDDKTISGAEVSSMLGKNEAVVQWISFNYKAPEAWSNKILYAAFIIKPNDTIPKFIAAFEESKLQKLLEGYQGNAGRGVTVKNTAKNENKDLALYNLIWKPLLSYLDHTTVIYNLPAGLLHKVSFAALTDSVSGKQLIDSYEIHQLLSIQELVSPQKTTANKNTIALFGGANYNAVVSASSPIATTVLPLYRNATDQKNIRFNYLPGTKAEVEIIASNTKNTAWKYQMYSSTTATEDNFKRLNGNAAPKILHLATHGFYFLPQKRNLILGVSPPKDFPLLRSGLVLSGANNYWGKDLPVNVEDGILTAQEISNMNLLNTDLVVLSACQTALGDISASEGVYGLQRAFKMAGAKKLLMSLWEVPDAETAELMQLFYTGVFNGDSYYNALRKAQLNLKAKYKDPNKWAAFVLVGQ